MPDEIATTMTADTTEAFAPALSATSDMPVAAPAEAPAPVVAAEPPAETPAPKEGETPAPKAEEPPVETSEQVAAREDRGVGKKLNKLETERDAERQRADKLQEQLNEALIKRTQEPETPPKVEEPAARPVRPRQAEHETPEAYEAAMDAYEAARDAWVTSQAEKRVETKTATEKEAEARVAREAEQNAEIGRVTTAHNERLTQAKERLPDFDTVVNRPDIMITNHMGMGIMNADNGPDVLYHMAQNPGEATRIAALPPALQLLEIGKLSARIAPAAVAEPVKREVSLTPPPIKPVGARNAAAEPDLGDMSMDDYAAKRQAAINAERTGQTRH